VAAPHLIMTYCALLALAVLRDDYALLDRTALARMVGACQAADGGCVLTRNPPPSLPVYGRQRAVNMDFVDF
jgi:prenyltransferase beta subunit